MKKRKWHEAIYEKLDDYCDGKLDITKFPRLNAKANALAQPVTRDQMECLLWGEFIQGAFPDQGPDEREFMFILYKGLMPDNFDIRTLGPKDNA